MTCLPWQRVCCQLMRINWAQSLLTKQQTATKKQKPQKQGIKKECVVLSASCSSSRIEVDFEVAVKVALRVSLLLLLSLLLLFFRLFLPKLSSSIRNHNSQSSFPSSSSLLSWIYVVRSQSTRQLIAATLLCHERNKG